MLGAEVPRQLQEQLMQTLIVQLLKSENTLVFVALKNGGARATLASPLATLCYCVRIHIASSLSRTSKKMTATSSKIH